MATIEALCGGAMVNTEFENLFKKYYQEINNIEAMKNTYIKSMKENAYIVNEALWIY